LKFSSFSRSFAKDSEKSWRSKLCEVHSHAWKKWQEKRHEYPNDLNLGAKEPQEPGKIQEDIMRQVKAEVDGLGARTIYHRKY